MISIIIPVYNVEKYLNQCIESIISQTYTEWECILVNDGSKDNSGKICDSWAKKESRIYVIHQINQGVSAARNKGIKESKGEYIVFIDSDDWVEPNYLSDMLRGMFKNNNPDLVVTGNNHHITPERTISYKPNKELYSTLSNDITSDFIKNIGLFYGPTSLLYKASIIKDYKIRFPEDYSLGEDLLFNFQYLSKVKYVLFIPIANYNYRIQEFGSLSSIYRDNTFYIHYQQWKIQKEFLKNKDMWNEISQEHFYTELWGIIYNGLFNKLNPSYTYIKSILNIDELKGLKKWENKFQCSKWIKKLILYKQSILLYFFLNAKK